MALTSTDINNQRFSIDRKGYDVDEVDVFLERVADELDEMNDHIAMLEAQGGGFAPIPSQAPDGFARVNDGPIDQDPVVAEQETIIAEQESVIAELNANLSEQAAVIADLEKQLDAALAADTPQVAPAPIAVEGETELDDSAQAALAERDARIASLVAELEEKESELASIADKDARIAELEAELAEKESDSNAVSQALVVAQRSAAEIVSNSEKKANEIISQAREDAEEILQHAQEEKQRIIDATADYRENRDEAQDAYKATLEEVIETANSKLLSLTGDIERRLQTEREMRRDAAPASAPMQQAPAQMWTPEAARYSLPQQAPINAMPVGYQPVSNYVTPATDAIVVNPSRPVSAGVEKDMSGYGDTGIYDFSDVD